MAEIISALVKTLTGGGVFPILIGSLAMLVAIFQTFARFYKEYLLLRRERMRFEAEKKELSKTIVHSLSHEESNSQEEVSKKIEEELLRLRPSERSVTWATNLGDARDRLTDEISALRSSARSYLLYGLAFSLFSLSALGVFAFVQNTSHFDEVLGRELLYRLGFALLLQTVGYFFLRLYVKNHIDIKYYNNELTNLDVKEAAIRLTLDRKLGLTKLVEGLSKIERNFILKKGENSIYDDHREYLGNIADKVAAAIRPLGGK
jgi:ABC-type multidrug transport system fused ATPase/permease subunit